MFLFNNFQNNIDYERITDWLLAYHSTENVVKKNKLKTRIVIEMMAVVKRLARTIARRSYDPIEDLVQAGSVGLLKAIENYSREKNENFQIYAACLIIGEIKHYLRDKLNCIHVPRHIQELCIRINNFTSNLTYEELQQITSEEVATALNLPKSTVDLALLADRRKITFSLDALVYEDNSTVKFEDFVTDQQTDATKKESAYDDIASALRKIIESLPEDDRIFIEMYYYQNMTRGQIAEAMQVNRMTVYRHIKHSINIILKTIEKNKKLKQKIYQVMQFKEGDDVILS